MKLTLIREYPGYDFRSGYASNDAVEKDYQGLGMLLKETRQLFGSGPSARVVSMAYYPDGRQEQLLKKHSFHVHADFLNIMSYVGAHAVHSSKRQLTIVACTISKMSGITLPSNSASALSARALKYCPSTSSA